MREKPNLTTADIHSLLRDRSNWGRWGDDDQRGAINLITAEKRAAAAGLVRTGRSVSISRDFPTVETPLNPRPMKHTVNTIQHMTGGAALDHLSFVFHGFTATHVDALCHVWDEQGLWNGRKPEDSIAPEGVNFGGIEAWRDGITTRGVLLDVPKFRGEPFVTIEKPVHCEELEAIAKAQGVEMEPGDALVLYGGREKFTDANPEWRMESPSSPTPGFDASCLAFIRDHDVAVVAWDMLDASPNPYGIPWAVHGAIFAYGIALVDNALVEPLADACAEENRYEFMLTFAPIPIVGGTGSPVNPIALF
jgi:kynurenine formamidase